MGHGPPLSLREKHKNILNIKNKRNTEMKKKEKKKDFNSLGFGNISKGMLNCKQYRFFNWVFTCNELAFTLFFFFISY